MTKLEHALRLAALGFRVFPIWPASGVPIKDFPALATRDPAVIAERGWWRERRPGQPGADANIGISTDGLCVIDVDVKNGKRGRDSLDLLRLLHGDLPDTYSQTTTTGGAHLVFSAGDAEVHNSTGKLGNGLDVRGYHGFIVGAGSTRNGKVYLAGPHKHVAPAPAWLIDEAGRADPNAKPQREPVAELDVPDNVARVVDYLKNTAQPAVQYDGGNATCYRVAARVKDLGVSERTAVDLMLEHWNPRCSPEWSPGELDEFEAIVSNAYRYGKNAPGSATPAGDFSEANGAPPLPAPAPLSGEVLQPPARGGPVIIPWDDEDDEPEPEPLIDGLFGWGETILAYGAPGVGKSFVIMRACHSIASGAQFAGRDVERGAVLYVAAEGHSGIRKRRKALRKKLGGHQLPLDFMVANLNLPRRPADRAAVRAAADQLVARTGQRLALIVYDTMSATSPGMDENAAGEVSAAIEAVRAIAAGTGAASLVIHHEGKAKGTGPRGSSAFTGNVDVQIRISEGLIESDKEREAGKMAPLRFDLEAIEVGRTRKGRPVTSCVARVYSSAESDFAERPMTEQERQAYDVLRDLCLAAATDDGTPGRVSVDAWRRAYASAQWGVARKPLTEAQRTEWRRLRNALRDKGWSRENNSDEAIYVEKA